MKRRDASGNVTPLFDHPVPTTRAPTRSAQPQERKPGQCGTCRMMMPREFWRGFGAAPEPVHCDGSVAAYGALRRNGTHHGRIKHNACWKCKADLGCDQCAGPLTEVFCQRCAAWGTQEAFARHGAISNQDTMLSKRRGKRAPEFADYPDAFQHHYYRENPNGDESTGNWSALKQRLAAVHVMPEPGASDWDETVKGG